MATATTTPNTTSATNTPSDKPQLSLTALTFDAEHVKREVARNWKWIMAGGIASVLAGTLALFAPVLATAAVATFIAALLLVVGCVNLTAPLFARDGMQLDSFLIGVVQVLLAAVMTFYPFESVVSMTIVLAAVFLVEGLLRTGIALAAREVPGWGWTLAGGLSTVVLSGLIIAGLPGAAFWVIGLLVGIHMISSGIGRIALASAGRTLAKAATE